MSELNAYTYDDMLNGVADVDIEYYSKSEADKVIAEKDAEIAQLQAMLEERNKHVGELKKACNDKDDWCLHTLKENRHHKYKRCVGIAKWCYDRWIRAYNSSRLQKAKFYAQWQKRWEKLAEKFKEATNGL